MILQHEHFSMSCAARGCLGRLDALDSLGNWQKTAYSRVVTIGGTPQPYDEVRQHNYLNQTTRRVLTSGGVTKEDAILQYDHGNNAASSDPDVRRRGNGNLVTVPTPYGTRSAIYDALNRLKELSGVPSVYTYDALGRRTYRSGPGGQWNPLDLHFYYTGVQCVEERTTFPPFAGGPVRQYVWGRYVDELLQQRSYVPLSWDYYPLSDLLYRTVALFAGPPHLVAYGIVEVYDIDVYGQTRVYCSGGGVPAQWFSDYDVPSEANEPRCRYLLTGREFEWVQNLYFYRARYYLPTVGRFMSRDPWTRIPTPDIGPSISERLGTALVNAGRFERGRLDLNSPEWIRSVAGPTETPADEEQVNLYQCARSNPARFADPRGLRTCKWSGTIGVEVDLALPAIVGRADVDIFSRDDDGYHYQLKAKGDKWLPALALSAAGLTTFEAKLDDTQAVCMWPISDGDIPERPCLRAGAGVRHPDPLRPPVRSNGPPDHRHVPGRNLPPEFRADDRGGHSLRLRGVGGHRGTEQDGTASVVPRPAQAAGSASQSARTSAQEAESHEPYG